MKSSKLSYRAEIDGLQAIAVVSVILYHAQMVLFGRDWFEGGFIGVDIFFVISGYLITSIILSELESKGSFSFMNFYERRARRILSVLFVVIFVSIPFAWQKLLPSDFVEYAESILASLFFASNFFFYFSTIEYGADSALLKTFLHTWSLGVEEQFYLAFPVLAIVAFKYFRKHFLIIVVGLSLLSVQFAELMEVRNADLNFYLPLSRFWELAVGSMLAYRELYYKPSNEGFVSKSLPIFGLCLIAYSILFFDGKTPHPSFHTLIPIVGVALIIGFASKDELVGKVLGSKPFVWTGLISYSAYLWHFPIFAFSRMGSSEPTNSDKLEWIVVTLVLSVISYWIVEKPFRRTLSKRNFIIVLLVSIISVSFFSLYVIKSDGVATISRLGFNINLINTATRPSQFFNKSGANSCDREVVTIEGLDWCELGQPKAKKIDVVVLGDSHSVSSTVTLNKLLVEKELKGLYFGTAGCPPLIDLYAIRGSPHPSPQSNLCQNHVKATLEMAKQRSIKSVLLIARWDYYVDGSNSGDWNRVTSQNFSKLNKSQARDEYAKAALRTFRLFSSEGIDLYVLLQVPHQKINPKRIFEEVLTKGSSDKGRQFLKAERQKFLKLSEHNERQLIANSAWKALLNEETVGGKLVLIDPTEVFCDERVCPIFDNEKSFYFDDDHPSTFGFERLESIIREAMFGD